MTDRDTPSKRRRREHSPMFKRELVARSLEPGASVAAADAHADRSLADAATVSRTLLKYSSTCSSPGLFPCNFETMPQPLSSPYAGR